MEKAGLPAVEVLSVLQPAGSGKAETPAAEIPSAPQSAQNARDGDENGGSSTLVGGIAGGAGAVLAASICIILRYRWRRSQDATKNYAAAETSPSVALKSDTDSQSADTSSINVTFAPDAVSEPTLREDADVCEEGGMPRLLGSATTSSSIGQNVQIEKILRASSTMDQHGKGKKEQRGGGGVLDGDRGGWDWKAENKGEKRLHMYACVHMYVQYIHTLHIHTHTHTHTCTQTRTYTRSHTHIHRGTHSLTQIQQGWLHQRPSEK